MDLSKMKVSELREALKTKGLNTTGNKQELIDRLQAASSEGTIDSKFEDELLNDDDLESEEKSLLDSTNDLLKSPDSSKSTTPETSAPPKKITLKRNAIIEAPILEHKTVSDEKNDSEPDKKVIKISELSAQDRLEMRAKKFGGNSTISGSSLPSQSKLDARAARFGLSSSNTSSSNTITFNSSTDALKKRAERFGAISDTVKKTEYEEKLLKRKERFGNEGKISVSSTPSDVDYEEKARLRMERFKQTA